MYTVVVTIHVIVCIILVLTVLLQQGKGAEVGAVFGSSEAMFGSAGPASALNKLTTVVAIIFMITSLALTYLAAHKKGDSVMEDVKVQAPAVPAATQSIPGAVPAEEIPAEAVPAQQRNSNAAVPAENSSVSKSTVDNTAGDVVKAAAADAAADAAARGTEEAVKDAAKSAADAAHQAVQAAGAEEK